MRQFRGGMEPFKQPTEEEDEEEKLHPQPKQRRVIVHLDLDCFYAQVEMLRDAGLRAKPLGVQQKSLVVTCNYEARKVGVKKLMPVREAKKKCPQLILVNGEDLTPYREMSYKVTEVLREFCPLVERLGFDENFLDITELVEKRLKQLKPSEFSRLRVSGHVYNEQTPNLQDWVHLRLIVGSQVAGELREAVAARLGLTGCAGVACNKLLAKLVSGTFKPNQQTVLLPESCGDLMQALDGIQKVPGIGPKTTQCLEKLGVRSVCELQVFPATVLEKELGVAAAQRIQKLSYGEDESPVTPSGPPKSISDEDSFQKCSSELEVKKKMEELLPKLLNRVAQAGRWPHTVRLSIRRLSAAGGPRRESRQCPVPSHLLHQLGKANSSILPSLLDVLLRLFRKMVDVTLPFHLTLLNICFSNLQELPSSKKGSITSHLQQVSPPSGSAKRPLEAEDASRGAAWNPNFQRAGKSRKVSEEGKKEAIPAFLVSPGAIDLEVFRELPEDIQKEILSGKDQAIPAGNIWAQAAGSFLSGSQGSSSKSKLPAVPTPHGRVGGSSQGALPSSWMEKEAQGWLKSRGKTPSSLEAGRGSSGVGLLEEDQAAPGRAAGDAGKLGCSREVGIILPLGVDTAAFSQLPAEVQQELLREWKAQKTAPEKSPGKAKTRKRRRSVAAGSSANSLLRYFKPQ